MNPSEMRKILQSLFFSKVQIFDLKGKKGFFTVFG